LSESEVLAARLRGLVALDPRVTEKRMFGGICFLLDGRILICIRRSGSLLVQCGAAAAAEATRQPGVTPVTMAGRPQPNFIDVADDSLENDDRLRHWIEIAERYVAALPPKR
jgi:hypothetical protein